MAHCTQVVNIIAPTLFEPFRLFPRTSPSSFSRLRHLTLMIDPMRCFFDKPSQLNTSVAEIGNLSQLDSLYIGFIYGFGCSRCGSSTCVRRSADAEDSINLCLSSMQHLESVHLDSFWPALLELPSRACLHATFKSTPGQKHPGLWAGRPADMHNPWLPLTSAHFLPGSEVSAVHAITATELWPLKVKRVIDLIRVTAGTLHMKLSEYPGLMQAERVLITASEIRLKFPSNHGCNRAALTKGKCLQPSSKRLVISNVETFAAQVGSLAIRCIDSIDTCPVSLLFLRNAVFMTGNELDVSNPRIMCQPDGRKRPGWGVPSLGLWSAETMGLGGWAHAVRCCCHACLVCLHRNGAAAFPEAIA